MEKAYFQSGISATCIDLGAGTQRRILAHNEQLMAVEVCFETGAEGKTHSHPHTQCSYVLSGKFRYTVEDESVDMIAGDSIVVPSNSMNGTVCLEKGILLDIFTPQRDDFLKS